MPKSLDQKMLTLRARCFPQPLRDGICEICYEPLERDTPMVSHLFNLTNTRNRRSRTDCKHTWHVLCLGQWLQVSPTCPACRAHLGNATVENHRIIVEQGFKIEWAHFRALSQHYPGGMQAMLEPYQRYLLASSCKINHLPMLEFLARKEESHKLSCEEAAKAVSANCQWKKMTSIGLLARLIRVNYRQNGWKSSYRSHHGLNQRDQVVTQAQHLYRNSLTNDGLVAFCFPPELAFYGKSWHYEMPCRGIRPHYTPIFLSKHAQDGGEEVDSRRM